MKTKTKINKICKQVNILILILILIGMIGSIAVLTYLVLT